MTSSRPAWDTWDSVWENKNEKQHITLWRIFLKVCFLLLSYQHWVLCEFKIDLFRLVFMCMYDWGFLCAPRACRCSWSPEGGDIFPQTGVTAVMRHSLWVLRSEPQSSLRTLNHWTMSCCVVFWDRISFCITGCPETPGVDQTSLRLIGICLLLPQVLASKGRATTLSLRYLIYPWHIWRKEISYLGSLSTRKKDKTEFALRAEGRRWQHSRGLRCWQVLSPHQVLLSPFQHRHRKRRDTWSFHTQELFCLWLFPCTQEGKACYKVNESFSSCFCLTETVSGRHSFFAVPEDC